MQIVEQETYRGHEIKICYDENPDSPRDWDNAGHMVCWHKRYKLGDENDFKTPEDFEEFCESPESSKDEVIKLPIYMYEHSGITINTTGFSCMWDSGQVGWIYITYGEIEKEFQLADGSLVRKQLIEKAIACMISEVKVYNQFLMGDVYGFVIAGELCDESCWGHYEKEELIPECHYRIDHSILLEEERVREMQLMFAL